MVERYSVSLTVVVGAILSLLLQDGGVLAFSPRALVCKPIVSQVSSSLYSRSRTTRFMTEEGKDKFKKDENALYDDEVRTYMGLTNDLN